MGKRWKVDRQLRANGLNNIAHVHQAFIYDLIIINTTIQSGYQGDVENEIFTIFIIWTK